MGKKKNCSGKKKRIFLDGFDFDRLMLLFGDSQILVTTGFSQTNMNGCVC